jgi:hypothetical protein
MPSKEEILIERTYKNLPVAQRILYTLTVDEVIKVDQTAKTVGLLVETLVKIRSPVRKGRRPYAP